MLVWHSEFYGLNLAQIKNHNHTVEDVQKIVSEMKLAEVRGRFY